LFVSGTTYRTRLEESTVDWRSIAVAVTLVGCAIALPACSPATAEQSAYEAAAADFSKLPVDVRYEIQMLLISAGYSVSVSTDLYSTRIFDAISRFQSHNGFQTTGLLTLDQFKLLRNEADPVLTTWGLSVVHHPDSGLPLWVPTRLGLIEKRTESGLDYEAPNKSISILFHQLRSADLATTYKNLLSTITNKHLAVKYQLLKEDFFVIAGNFTGGNITAAAGIGDDTRMLQISAPVQPGNSGGPLLDQSGNLVGLVVAKLNALRVAAVTEDLAQNVNFAIKSALALDFLEANNISATMSVNMQPLPPADIADRARSFSVYIRRPVSSACTQLINGVLFIVVASDCVATLLLKSTALSPCSPPYWIVVKPVGRVLPNKSALPNAFGILSRPSARSTTSPTPAVKVCPKGVEILFSC
jgi:trypsin-like peptidase/putative peptidoglycan binding protein